MPDTLFLKKHADYRRAYDASVRGRTPLLGWFAARREPLAVGASAGEPQGLRVGLTVPKAIGNAVVRNRIKRRMREAVRQCASEELRVLQLDIILHPRREAATCDWQTLLTETGRALREAVRRADEPRSAKTSRPAKRKPHKERRTPLKAT